MAEFGPKESNSKEGMGLILMVSGIIAFTAGWAYADGGIQVIFVLLGIAAFVAGFGVLRAAKTAG
jgi:sugar phosphate permease